MVALRLANYWKTLETVNIAVYKVILMCNNFWGSCKICVVIQECPKNLDDVDLDSAAWLAYTSGTTGLAKCIVLPHRSVVGAFIACCKYRKRWFIPLLINIFSNIYLRL